MVFSYEHKVIIKYLREKYTHGARKIVADHPEFGWNEHGVKKLLKKIDETGDIARKEGSGRPKTSRTDENIEMVEEMILSQEEPGTHQTPAEIAAELGIHRRQVQQIIDEDLDLKPIRKMKVQSLSDADMEKRNTRAVKLLRTYTREVLKTAFFSDEKIFKVKQQYNSQNDVCYIPKKMKKSDVSDERLLRQQATFPQKIMVSVSVSKAGKTKLFFVDPGTKVNAHYYSNVLMKKMIPQMDRRANGENYLFMQDGARAHTAKLTLGNFAKQKQLTLLQPQDWPPNSPDLNPVDFGIWGILEENVYRGRRITNIESLKEALVTEWNLLPQETINRCIDAFRPRLKRVVEVGGGHIEKYF